MAAEYRSLRTLDSLTKNSANKRILSASSAADASLWANASNRSIVPRENWSGVWLIADWREIGWDGDEGAGTRLPTALDEDRL